MDAFGNGEIQAVDGRLIKLLELTPDMVTIEDIAHALSMLPRFLARTLYPLSVAHHSVTVSRIYPSIHSILHDCSEAFFFDIPSPIKRYVYVQRPSSQQCTPEIYAQTEKRVMGVIYEALGVPLPTHEETARLHRADLIALITEKRDFLCKPKKDWADMGAEPMQETLHPIEWHEAKRQFLRRYEELRGGLPH